MGLSLYHIFRKRNKLNYMEVFFLIYDKSTNISFTHQCDVFH